MEKCAPRFYHSKFQLVSAFTTSATQPHGVGKRHRCFSYSILLFLLVFNCWCLAVNRTEMISFRVELKASQQCGGTPWQYTITEAKEHNCWLQRHRCGEASYGSMMLGTWVKQRVKQSSVLAMPVQDRGGIHSSTWLPQHVDMFYVQAAACSSSVRRSGT